MHQLYLSLGSNLGDREHMLQEALRLIGENIGTVVRVSSFIETRPWGYESEHLFLNAACKVETTLSPTECLHVTQEIERRLGRTAKSHNGYSPIDIDLLSYDDVRMDTPELTLPHPRMHERDFVMIPLKEITQKPCGQI